MIARVASILLASLLTLTACTERNFTPDEEAISGPLSVVLDEAFELGVGQTAFFEDVEVLFATVRGDNRCPLDVTCIIAGEVVVELHIKRTGESKTALILGMPGLVETPYLASAEVEHRGFTFKLLDVTPYPVSSGAADARDYRILLRLSSSDLTP